MTGADVIRIVDQLESDGIRLWLDGGWGVDALIRRQTRDHSDLDVVVELDRADEIIATLSGAGYQLSLNEQPTRFVMEDGERHIDFHLIVFDESGDARQIGAGPDGGDAIYPADGLLGRGSIEGRNVPCLTPKLLVRHHLGYEPQDKDRHNVRLLCEHFGLPVPAAYRATEAGGFDT